MLSSASSLVVSLCQLQSLASSLPTKIFEGNTGRGPDLVWTTSKSGLSIEGADGGDWYMATNDLRSRCAPSRTPRRSVLGARQCVRAPLARLASCQRFLALPVTSPVRLRSGFPLGDYQRESLVPGIPKNRHNFTAIYRLGLLALRGWLLLTMRDAALDCGAFCADLLNEGLDFVGIADKLMLSKAGCNVQSRSQALLTEGLNVIASGRLRSFFPLIENYEKVSCEFWQSRRIRHRGYPRSQPRAS